MTKGSCLCGAVQFELGEAGVVASVGCYCANCRKVSGSQFGVYLQVRPASFRWVSGQAEVATYESSPGNRRGFCRRCGSVAPVATSYGAMRVPAGALDDALAHRPDAILFAKQKPAWCGPDEGADRTFDDAGPPEFWRDVIVRLYQP